MSNKIDFNINSRATERQIQELIKKEIMPMLKANHTFIEIREHLRSVTGKSNAQLHRYIKMATDILKIDFNRDIEQQRIEMIASLRSDMDECLKNYKVTEGNHKIAWYKQYIEVKDRIAKLAPNQLQSTEETNGQKIEITYTKVDK